MSKDHDDDNDRLLKGTLPGDPAEGTVPMPRPSLRASPGVLASEPPRWGRIIPFGVRELPSFPVDRLPSPLREMVMFTAEATQTPPDMAAMLGLAVASVCCAGKTEIGLADGYVEPINCYVAIVMEPGNRKSAVAAGMTAPVQEFERKRREQLGPTIARARAEREAQEERLGHLKREAARAKESERRSELQAELGDLAEVLAQRPRPEFPRILADDVTPEQLATLMAANAERLGVISAEGGIFDTIAGRYSNGVPNLDVFLKGHAGDPLRVDRRNGTALCMEAPALTIGLAIQPDVLHGMATKPGFMGRGLFARFWFSIPRSLVGWRKPAAPATPIAVREAYGERIRVLLERQAEGEGRRTRLVLSASASQMWRDFSQMNERALQPDGRLTGIKEWASKLPGAVGRIAGLLHCVDSSVGAGMAVADHTMSGAIEIGRYLSAHALAAHDLLGADPIVDMAKRLIAWVERSASPEFSFRDAYQALKGGKVQKVRDLEPAMSAAEEHCFIRRIPNEDTEGPGRRPSQRFEANPELFKAPSFPRFPQNPQNEVSPHAASESGGIGGNETTNGRNAEVASELAEEVL
jgi:replicative DNA helicase